MYYTNLKMKLVKQRLIGDNTLFVQDENCDIFQYKYHQLWTSSFHADHVKYVRKVKLGGAVTATLEIREFQTLLYKNKLLKYGKLFEFQ